MFRPAEKALLALTAHHCVLYILPIRRENIQRGKENKEKSTSCFWKITEAPKLSHTPYTVRMSVSNMNSMLGSAQRGEIKTIAMSGHLKPLV